MSNFIKYYCHKDSKTGEAEWEVNFNDSGFNVYYIKYDYQGSGNFTIDFLATWLYCVQLIEVTPEEHERAFAKYHPEFKKEEIKPEAKTNIFSRDKLVLDGTPFFEYTDDGKVLVLGRECFSDRELENRSREYLNGILGIPQNKAEQAPQQTKEVDLVGEALEKVKKEMVIVANYAGDFIEATQNLVTALEAERNKAVMKEECVDSVKVEPKVDIKKLVLDDMRKKHGSRMENGVETIDLGVGKHEESLIFEPKSKSIWKDRFRDNVFENDGEIVFFRKGDRIAFGSLIWHEHDGEYQFLEIGIKYNVNDNDSSFVKLTFPDFDQVATLSDFIKDHEDLKARVSKLEGR